MIIRTMRKHMSLYIKLLTAPIALLSVYEIKKLRLQAPLNQSAFGACMRVCVRVQAFKLACAPRLQYPPFLFFLPFFLSSKFGNETPRNYNIKIR